MKNTVNNRKRISTKTIKNGSLRKKRGSEAALQRYSYRKRCSENMRQIYRRTLMPECDQLY